MECHSVTWATCASLSDDTSAMSGDVFAANIDRRMARIAALETCEQAQGPTVVGREHTLPRESHTRQNGNACFCIEYRDRQRSLADMHPKFDRVGGWDSFVRKPRGHPGMTHRSLRLVDEVRD